MNPFKRMQTLFIALLAAFVVIDAALITYLLWPGASNPAVRKAEEQQLRQQLKTTIAEVGPLRGIDQKLVNTRADIKKFYADRIPVYWSQIAGELHKLETANGVSEASIHYMMKDTELPNLQRIEIDTGVASEYTKIAHFINALERDPL